VTSSTMIPATTARCIEPIWAGRATPPPWDSRLAKFARRLGKRDLAEGPIRRQRESLNEPLPKSLIHSLGWTMMYGAGASTVPRIPAGFAEIQIRERIGDNL
jgi:hypothetical protein